MSNVEYILNKFKWNVKTNFSLLRLKISKAVPFYNYSAKNLIYRLLVQITITRFIIMLVDYAVIRTLRNTSWNLGKIDSGDILVGKLTSITIRVEEYLSP